MYSVQLGDQFNRKVEIPVEKVHLDDLLSLEIRWKSLIIYFETSKEVKSQLGKEFLLCQSLFMTTKRLLVVGFVSWKSQVCYYYHYWKKLQQHFVATFSILSDMPLNFLQNVNLLCRKLTKHNQNVLYNSTTM